MNIIVLPPEVGQQPSVPSRIVLNVQMDAEKAFVDGAAEEGRIVVHPTTCYGVRECGGSETFDQSCHWGTDGRYVCLRHASLSCQPLVALHHHVATSELRCKIAWACAVLACVQMREAAVQPDRQSGTLGACMPPFSARVKLATGPWKSLREAAHHVKQQNCQRCMFQ